VDLIFEECVLVVTKLGRESHSVKGDMMKPFISILIPTQGRIDQLRRLLHGLSRLDGRENVEHEIIVCNNAQDDVKVRSVEAMVKYYVAKEPKRWQLAREPLPGKSRALNKIIPLSRGQILGFLDDDVEVNSLWLQATCNFFSHHPFDVMQGSILVPPEMAGDEKFLKLLNRYRTICYYHKPGMEVREIRTLNAANIAFRRELLEKTGLFDERIGPGQSGTSMDVEFGERVLSKGRRIGYEPSSIVYHEVDWNRLTEDYFRLRHERQGRSRLLYKSSSLPTITGDLIRATCILGLYSLLNDERKKYRAKGRYFHYRAMFGEKIRRSAFRMRQVQVELSPEPSGRPPSP
jgi:glucosyl-dolichyl phosphate glucuronosyltransferase